MPNKVFLGWQKDFKTSVLDLVLKFKVPVNIVLPSLNLCSELSSIFVKESYNAKEIIPLKPFLASLLDSKLKIANSTIRIFTWQKVLKNSDRLLLQKLFPGEFKFGEANLFNLASLINEISEKIFDNDIDFQNLAKICEDKKIDNSFFWSELGKLNLEYTALLKSNGYIDANYELIHQKEFKTPLQITIIAGCHNLNKQAARIIKSISEQTIIAINASEKHKSGYTEIGNLDLKYWEKLESPISNVLFFESVSEEIEYAKTRSKQKSDNSILNIHTAESSIVRLLSSELASEQINFDNQLAQKLATNDLIKLILVLLEYCQDNSSKNLARLIREKHIRKFISKNSEPSNLIHEINQIRTNFLPEKLALDCPILAAKLDTHKNSLQAVDLVLKDFKAQQSLETAITNLISKLEIEIKEEDTKCLAILLENLAKIDASKLNDNSLTSIREVINSLSFNSTSDLFKVKIQNFAELSLAKADEYIILGTSDQNLPKTENEIINKPLAKEIGIIDYSIANASHLTAYLAESGINYEFLSSKFSAQNDSLTPSRFLFRGNRANNAERIINFTSTKSKTVEQKFSTYLLTIPEISKVDISRISASSLKDYINCPYLFYLNHVLKLEQSKDHALEMNDLVFGSLAHEILENFSKNILTGLSSKNAFELAYQNTIDQYFPWPVYPAVILQLEQLKFRLEYKIELQEQLTKEGWSIYKIEYPFEEKFDLAGKKIRITGKIDRIDYNKKENAYRIIDFKTANDPSVFEKIFVNETWSDLQLPIYASWIRKNNPEQKIELAYINFSRNKKDFGIRTMLFDDNLFELSKKQLNNIIHDIITNKFSPKEPDKWPDKIFNDRTI